MLRVAGWGVIGQFRADFQKPISRKRKEDLVL
jgi:hypothetical protein